MGMYLVGDKAWSAIFDNSKVKTIVGDFYCVQHLQTILEEPIKHLKNRLVSKNPERGAFDELVDRICRERSAPGR